MSRASWRDTVSPKPTDDVSPPGLVSPEVRFEDAVPVPYRDSTTIVQHSYEDLLAAVDQLDTDLVAPIPLGVGQQIPQDLAETHRVGKCLHRCLGLIDAGRLFGRPGQEHELHLLS